MDVRQQRMEEEEDKDLYNLLASIYEATHPRWIEMDLLARELSNLEKGHLKAQKGKREKDQVIKPSKVGFPLSPAFPSFWYSLVKLIGKTSVILPVFE